MSTGLLALLDDVAAIAKVAAASLDDVAAQAMKAGAKSAGVVIDDAAVTPRYVVGFAAERELPIVKRIATGSIKNKLLILLPAALALSFFLPSAITPLLMLGGLYLCYEGAEKVYELIVPHKAHAHEDHIHQAAKSPTDLEEQRVKGAIRTDFILSAEIMAIALATIPDSPLPTQAVVLALVAVGITAGVYGAVALIVKADDIGVAMGKSTREGALGAAWRGTGRVLVRVMPVFLKVLSAVGTAAMIWVGGGILIHGLEHYGLETLGHTIHHLAEQVAHGSPVLPDAVAWLVGALGSGVVGLAVGALLIPLVAFVFAPAWGAVAGLLRRDADASTG